MRIIETEQYKSELRKIALNIKKDKPSASVSFVRNLKTEIQNIPNFPYKYRKSFYFDDENIRDMIYKGYTIIYEISGTTIEIFKIFNQNLPQLKENTKEK